MEGRLFGRHRAGSRGLPIINLEGHALSWPYPLNINAVVVWRDALPVVGLSNGYASVTYPINQCR